MKKSCFFFSIVFLTIFLFPHNHCGFAQPVSQPKRVVVVEQKEDVPAWKLKWDQARELVRQQDFKQAALNYSELLSMKSNIEEAKWEYLQLLTRLGEWGLASNLIESLIEHNPQSVSFRLSGGQISLEKEEYERAAKYFSWVFTRTPNGNDGLIALEGLIEALQGLGRTDKALPLIEQLYIRKPDDPILLKKLATLSLQHGLQGKSAHYLSILIEKFPVDDRIIFQAANLYDHMGKREKAVFYWEKYVQRHPEYLPFQKKISDFYLTTNKPKQALRHLIHLLENGKRSDELLLIIGNIYLDDHKRPDKALLYLQEYSQNNPGNKTVQTKLDRIQTVLANNLVSIIENDGAWMLWKDLARLTPDRSAIYLSMVDVLDRLGKEEELHEALIIILEHEPDNQRALLRLAELQFKNNRVDESIRYFSLVKETEENRKRYLLQKAKLEEWSGKELAALGSFESYLKFDSTNRVILTKCMRLAGELGLVDRLLAHYQTLQAHYGNESSFIETEIEYVQLLRKNHFFEESEKIHTAIIGKVGKNTQKTATLLFAQADYFADIGLYFQAEQILRRVFISNFRAKDTLIKLVELSIRQSDLSAGWAWFSLLRRQSQVPSLNDQVNIAQQDPEVILLQAKLLSAESLDEQARLLLEKMVFQEKKKNTEKREQIHKDLPLFLVYLYMKTDHLTKAHKLANHLVVLYPDDRNLSILSDQIGSALKNKEKWDKEDIPFSYLVKKAEHDLHLNRVEEGLLTINVALSKVTNSVRARDVQARLLEKNGLFRRAMLVYKQLLSEFPSNLYFQKKLFGVELDQGNAQQIINDSFFDSSRNLEGKKDKRGFAGMIRLLLAEAYRAVDKNDMALSIYDSMISVPVETQLARRMSNAQISVELPLEEESFWDIITFSGPIRTDIAEKLMTPDFVGKHIGKLVNIITTELYAEYRWQKIIRKRKSLILGQIFP